MWNSAYRNVKWLNVWGRNIVFLALALGLSSTLLPGADRILWRIGKVDCSTLEFNQEWNFSTQGEPAFRPDKDDPAKGWSAFHPGSADQSAANRPHPFTVRFDLRNSPSGVFRLTINLLVKSSGIPQYIVDVNGRKGRFLLHPQLSQEIGDPATAWNILFSRQSLSLELPASDFHTGANVVVLTCIGGNYAAILGAEAKPPGHSPAFITTT